jgi:SAM-dependent methyltransferase
VIRRTHPFTSDDEFEAAVKQLYEDGSDQYAEWWENPHAEQAEAWEYFRSVVKPGGSVLDVGCNAGTDLRRMLDAGYTATGIDVSEHALELCRTRCPEARTIAMSMLDLCDFDEQFDGVWVAYSLLHIPFRRVHDALEALASVLHPDGVLMMTMSVVEEPMEHLHSSNVMRDAAGEPRKVPAAHWTPDALVEAFAAHFEICWELRRAWTDGWAPFSLLVKPLAAKRASIAAEAI